MSEDSPTRRAPGSRLTLSWKVSLLIAFLLLASAVVTIIFAVQTVRAELYRQSQESVANVHTAASEAVQADYDGIEEYRTQARQRRKDALRDEAAPVIAALNTLRQAADSGQMSTQQAHQTALQILRSVRFGKQDYFYTFDRDLNLLAHPDPAIEGTNMADTPDADGRYFVREFKRVALESGSGFVEYRWQRLNGEDPVPKIAYVFYYKPWKWILGTGVYIDDIDADVQEQINAVRDNLQTMVEQISFQGEGFFLVLDRRGEVVAAADPRFLATEHTPAGQQVIQDILAAAPTTSGSEMEVRLQTPWSEGVDSMWSLEMSATGGDLGWVLVSAVPTRSLEAPGARLALQLVLVSGLVLLIGMALGLLVSRRIMRPVDDITKAARSLQEDAFDPAMLDRAAARNDEVGQLARTFQGMGRQIVERERRLREQVKRLTVEIDQSKVDQEVQLITETDYFQHLKARAKELRQHDEGRPHD
jgi:HAMP domain-containing protein